MKILVTGGAGFIGSHVVDYYLEAGHQVIIVDNLSTGRSRNLNPSAKFYELDITSPDLRQIFADERPQVINHHAAQVDLRRAVREPVFDAQTNILGAIQLLELAREFSVRKFIYISSGGAVYGEPKYLPCDENHPIYPISPYGVSKFTPELYLHSYQQNFGLDYTILRYGNVYGPRQDPHGEAGVVAIFTGAMLHGQPITIFGSGEQERDFVYVGDCAHANLLALDRGSQGVYNLASAQATSINAIFTNLQSIIGYPHPARYGPAKPGETFRIYLDIKRAQQELGWKPKVDLKEGLKKTVTYTQENELA